jgi:hypothetical protein
VLLPDPLLIICIPHARVIAQPHCEAAVIVSPVCSHEVISSSRASISV